MNTSNSGVVRTKSPFAPRKLCICSSARHERRQIRVTTPWSKQSRLSLRESCAFAPPRTTPMLAKSFHASDEWRIDKYLDQNKIDNRVLGEHTFAERKAKITFVERKATITFAERKATITFAERKTAIWELAGRASIKLSAYVPLVTPRIVAFCLLCRLATGTDKGPPLSCQGITSRHTGISGE